jgi:SAM-dependent methyltransferase
MLARANFEILEHLGGALRVRGWMFVPEREVDGFALRVDGRAAGAAAPRERPDVRAAFPAFATALRSEFRFDVPSPADTFRDWVELEVAGSARGSEIAIARAPFRIGYADGFPTPPAATMQAVSNTSDPASFWRGGLVYFGVFARAMRRHGAAATPRVLDWGCGCGRIAAFVQRYAGARELHGCDIDPTAIEWCAAHLAPASFRTIRTSPPLPYAAGAFDVVIGCSVFTYLERRLQLEWLDELHRVMAPGGLLLVSIQGRFAALINGADRTVTKELDRRGISDSITKHTLDGIAPKDYAREVYQTREWVVANWQRRFEVVEYEEAGMGNFQDFVALRRR